MRDPRRNDVIQMTVIDTLTALASGADVLAENFAYILAALSRARPAAAIS